MQGLNLKTWQDWQNLCCYIMRDMVSKHFGDVTFKHYGSGGQGQHGIDLVPTRLDVFVVAQCKLTVHPFSLNMARDELKKTDAYPHKIEHYVFLTTADYHTSIQNHVKLGPWTHTRPDGSVFRVIIVHWRDIRHLDFVPNDVLEEIFPDAFRMVAPVFEPEPESAPRTEYSHEEYLKSATAMRAHMGKWITPANLTWLETWDFSLGFVQEVNFNPFDRLYFEYLRTNDAVNLKIWDWLNQGDRQLIAECLPAARGVFEALCEFRNAVIAQTYTEGPMGSGRLTLDGLAPSFKIKIISDWKSKAHELAIIVRRDVLKSNFG